MVHSRHPAWSLKQAVKSLKADFVFQGQQSRHKVHCNVKSLWEPEEPSSHLGLGRTRGFFFNVDNCVSNTQLPLLWVIIRRSISSVYTDSFATHTFSDASCFEMGYLMPPILTVGLGRVTLKLTVTHLNATVGILLGVANVEKSRALSMLSCVLNNSDKTKAGKLS